MDTPKPDRHSLVYLDDFFTDARSHFDDVVDWLKVMAAAVREVNAG